MVQIEYRQTKTEDVWHVGQVDKEGHAVSSMMVVQPHNGRSAYPCDVHMDKDLSGLLASQAVVDVASILLVALAGGFDHVRFVLESLLKIGKVSEVVGNVPCFR